MGKLLITIFGGWLGIHKFMERKAVVGAIYFCTFGLFGIGWIIDIIKAYSLFQTQSKSRECILVVGEYYRHNDICSVVSGNPLYNLPDSEFIKKITPDKRVYRYKYRKANGQLIAEPTNPHDKNAIKVMVDNVHVGYIPADRCQELKKKLSKLKDVEIHIGGGDYKYHSRNEVYKSKDDFNVKVYI